MKFSNLIMPLFAAGFALLVVALVLPFGAAAADLTPKAGQAVGLDWANLPPPRVNAAQVLPGTNFQLSVSGGRLPEIAANGDFVAVVFEANDRVYIVATKQGSGWGFTRQIDSAEGNTPKLAFQQNGITDTVHVVWTGDNGQYIRHTTCTLTDPTISCNSAANVNSVAASTGQLRTPDIAVDSSNGVHLAWVDRNNLATQTDNQIKTARSGNGGSIWTTVTAATLGDGGDNGGQPVLATAGSFVHLAYKDQIGGVWSIQYRRSNSSGHLWNSAVNSYDESVIIGYEQIGNPAVAASGTKVYLAWDNEESGGGSVFSLTGAQSTDFGASWPDHSDPAPYAPIHITSTNKSDVAISADEKTSYNTATPVEEKALRPSLAVRTDGDFAIVWQQRPMGGEGASNCTSEVYYAPDSSDWSAAGWGTVTADTQTYYSIDPDIAIDSNGEHVVFMQATDDSCQGGQEQDYKVYYRGPFDSYSPKAKRIFLPIVLKNS